MHRGAAAAVLLAAAIALPAPRSRQASAGKETSAGVTPVQHLVVIFQENESFDHYFGTYPLAANPPGEPAFNAVPGTPAVNGLGPALLIQNANLHAPFRVGRLDQPSCFENGGYVAEQQAYDRGLVDKFVEQFKYTSGPLVRTPRAFCPEDAGGNRYGAMGYVDGNSVTGLWNYTQQFAMSDNFYGTTFGPSTPGAIHLVAADTAGVLCGPSTTVYGNVPACWPGDGTPAGSATISAPSSSERGTLYGDSDPLWDICSKQDASTLTAMAGPNIGNLLNAAGVTWGWFQGGFAVDADGRCASAHAVEALDRAAGIDPASDTARTQDYDAHHEAFQYFASTANPQHLPPLSMAMVGRTDQANHQYDLSEFGRALESGTLPAVSFLKAAQYQDGHAGHSDPLDEQQFLVQTLNEIQSSPIWGSTAVFIAWDDSNGYYDHVMPPLVNRSNTPLDDSCGDSSNGPPIRCGYGPRLPLIVVSPFAKRNYVSHTLTDQVSIARFIEDNWLGGRRLTDVSFDNIAGSLVDLFDFSSPAAPGLILDPVSGEPATLP